MSFFKVSAFAIAIVFGFFLADLILGRGAEPFREGVSIWEGKPPAVIPFNHALHGDSLGIDCATCHRGSRSMAHAYFPSKKDCMDCHRLPLTENPEIEILDSLLESAPDTVWSRNSRLPEHVVFHHGVHAAAGVSCSDCHGRAERNTYGGENLNMQSCLQCHRGESFKGYPRAATDCATCHR